MTSGPDDLTTPYRVTGPGFRLADHRAEAAPDPVSKADATRLFRKTLQRLDELQRRLYADNRWSLLLVFQAMDAAGKDSTIRRVLRGVNPQGCQVFSFKAPSTEELDHDFLWRCVRALPERGRIGVFNRSYYEEVLVVRVHPELLDRQRLPGRPAGDGIWEERYRSIREFEHHLIRNGTIIRKFFLNVSREEQRQRFLDRLREPDKHWKFSARDVTEREHWDRYMAAYEEAIRATATPEAPWFVVPADRKWFTRLVVARAIVEALEELALEYPAVPPDQAAALAAARDTLLAEDPGT